MINETAYNTISESGMVHEKTIIHSLQKCLINKTLTEEKIILDNGDVINYYLVESSECEVIKFDHPILIDTLEKDKTGKYKKVIVTDVRNFGKYDIYNVKFNIKNLPEYNLAKERAILNTLWINGYINKIKDISILPAKIYVTTISELISRRYALNFTDTIIINILSCYFYYGLFTSDKQYSDEEYQTIIKRLATCLYPTPIENIYNTLESLNKKIILNISDLIDIIKDKCSSEALNDFSLGIFINLFNGLWYSASGKNLILTSLELPPSWIIICHAALLEQSYKKLTFTKLTEKYRKDKSDIDNFDKTLKILLSPNMDF